MELFLILKLILDPHILVTQNPIILTHAIQLLLKLNYELILFRYCAERLLQFTMMRMELLSDFILVVVLLSL